MPDETAFELLEAGKQLDQEEVPVDGRMLAVIDENGDIVILGVPCPTP